MAGIGRRPVGRRRTRDTRIPIWFGLPFLGGGLAVLWIGAGGIGQGSNLAVLGFGTLFAVVGAGVLWTAIRQRRPAAAAVEPNVGALDVVRFTRSPMQILIDLVLAPIGGFGFLVMAAIVAVAMPIIGLAIAILPLFFGVLLLRGSLITMRRGVRFTIAEVGPGGIWTPELGRSLGWDEIADIRVEDMTGVGGSNNTSTAVYRRLGIVPKDDDLIRAAPGRGAMTMARGFMRLVNTMRPGTGLSDPTALAPYGINASEVEQPFEAVIRAVERFAPVRGPDAAAVPEAPPFDAGVGAAALGDGFGRSVLTGRPTTVGHSPDAGAPDVSSERADPRPPSGTSAPQAFRRSEGFGATYGVLLQVPGTLIWLALSAIFLTLWIGIGGLAMPWFAYPFLLIPLVFLFDGFAQLLELASRIRMTRGDPMLLTVDADGIALRGMGRLRWDHVRTVRVVDSSMPTGEGSPPGRRLEIVPRDPAALRARPWSDRAFDRYRGILRRLKPFGDRAPRQAAFGLDLDLLDSPADEVLDAIARYTLVEET